MFYRCLEIETFIPFISIVCHDIRTELKIKLSSNVLKFRIVQTYDRLESQASFSGSNRNGQKMVRRSRSRSRASRYSQNHPKRSPRKSIVRSPARLPLDHRSTSKPSANQLINRSFSNGKSVQGPSKKRAADSSSSSRNWTETKVYSTGSNETKQNLIKKVKMEGKFK